MEVACDHDRRHGREDLARARRRLLSAQTQSVVHAAGSEQPAVAARWWLAVPHRPEGEDLRIRFRHALAPGASSHRVALSPARGRRQPATDRPGSSTALRGRDRAVAARRRANAGVPVGALPPRRPRAARPGRARRRDRTRRAQPPRRKPGSGATGFSTPSARAPNPRESTRPIPAGCVTPTERSRRSCTSARRRCTPRCGG